MKAFNLLLGASLASLSIAAAAAADLPTKKTAPAPAPAAPVQCWGAFTDWLYASPTDCPLSVAGITVYGQIDMGVGYQTQKSTLNSGYPNGISYLDSKQSHGAGFTLAPNALSQSNVGVKISEPLVGDFKFIGDANFGFDPYTLSFANGPGSLQSQNFTKQWQQQANGDSSRAGGFVNSRAYLGIGSDTYGTLTLGRLYTFENSLFNAYDPMGGAYAFGEIGSTGTLTAGNGVTQTARYNTALQYVYDHHKMFHVGGQMQVGGYGDDNGMKSGFQFNAGGSYSGFSLDGVYAKSVDSVAFATYGAPQAPPITQDNLKATLANISAFSALAKFQYQAFTVFGGYMHATLSNPSDPYAGGFSTEGITVLPAGVTNNAYTINKILQTEWFGVKYGVLSNLDVSAAYHHTAQNNYDTNPGANCAANTSVIAGSPGVIGQGTKKGDCAGTVNVLGGLIDYRPIKRVDTYLGVMWSKFAGGLANGLPATTDTAFTGGVRVTF